MNDAELRKIASKGEPCMVCVDRSLYFRISQQGTAFWVFRYSINGKRRSQQIGRYGKPPEGMSLRVARDLAAIHRSMVRDGIDPLAESKRPNLVNLKTVNEVAKDWLDDCQKRLANPGIPERVFYKDIAPSIGDLAIERVTPRDILGIIRMISNSGRPTIANDALSYLKQIFNHAIKLDLVQNNPASAFSPKDAGGQEHARHRALSLHEIQIFFSVMKDCSESISRENYLAYAILIVLGLRKGELIAARWDEFDLKNKRWTIPKDRTKSKVEITVPLPDKVIPWFIELLVRAGDSSYVFPSRRTSKRREYISDDTLNHALAKLFGKKVDGKKDALPNKLGAAGVDYFVVHDLRRTCRSLLASNGIPSHIAERCLNHKLKGVEGIYDRYDYFEERKTALNELAEQVAPLVGMPSSEIISISGDLALSELC
ncbi:site-specific integrase [Methylophaga thalassica]|uniref:tyrosine-type recombinase/integrase n=1 Tax=Methylophaga thalassica TaxID=40223 RepID=UPI002E7AD618|nr:site-specific integrase [Methylophaga thalassica]WVI84928.1 site-specific integrase [Methylophaga thalassica]